MHIDVLGHALSIRWWPENTGHRNDLPTFILLHEGLGSISLWRDFPEQLAAATGGRVLTYSRPGYGQSSPAKTPRTARYMHDEGLEILPALLDVLKITQPIIVGHSDGGSIGLIFAGSYPERLRALVTIAPHEWVEEEALTGIRQAGETWQNSDWPSRLAKHHSDASRVFHDWHDTWLSAAFRDWNILEYVDRIRCPLLALQGDRDEYATLRQVETLAERVPGCRMQIIGDCGHSPHREQPAATVAAIAEFYRELTEK